MVEQSLAIMMDYQVYCCIVLICANLTSILSSISNLDQTLTHIELYSITVVPKDIFAEVML